MKNPYSWKEICQYWVGLLDGDGSIQCNHWRKKSLEYRMVIKISATPENIHMLQLFQKNLGGSVRRVRQGNQFLWVEDHQRGIWKLVDILHKYPPLTSRLQCQLEFLESCAQHKDVQRMLAQRGKKYNSQPQRIESMGKKNLLQQEYWPLWCSGFIEAQGSFSLGANGRASFSIGQQNDGYLLETLRRSFGGVNRVRTSPDGFSTWQVYRRSVLERIISHCHQYPLLGHKASSLSRFSQRFVAP